MCNYLSNQNLLITEDELILIQIQNGVEVNRIIEKKDNYAESKSKELIKLYLMFKKINAHIANKKKWSFIFIPKLKYQTIILHPNQYLAQKIIFYSQT